MKKTSVIYDEKFNFMRCRGTNTPRLAMTPTAQIVALYAEYDSLLDTLEAVQVQLKSTRCCDQFIHSTL